MEEHVNKLCQSVNFHLRNIWKIRKYINKKCTETLVHALISSRVDYCNLLFSKMASYLLQKLQKLRNLAARIISRTPKTDHISSTLYALPWLPIDKCIQYKLLLMVFKALNGLPPSYLSELIVNYQPKRKLRLASYNLI